MNSNKFQVNRTIRLIDYRRITNSWEAYSNGNVHFAELPSSDFEIKEFNTNPIDSYIEPDRFPNCCEWHEDIYKQAQRIFDEFPNCCPSHRNLIDQPWFNKIDYTYLPLKLVSTIAYSLHCIGANTNEPAWYKQITDYLDYTISSYGQFPEGFGSPLGLSQYISTIEQEVLYIDKLTDNQKYAILEFLEKFTVHRQLKRAPELNKLIGVYKQWIRIFPFEICSLGYLKPYYQSQIPIISKMNRNMYSGEISNQIITNGELINNLSNITKSIIIHLNQLEEFKSSKRLDRQNTKIQLANAHHNLIQESVLQEELSDKPYYKILDKWLLNEKKHINELEAILNEDYSTETFILNVIEGMQKLQRGDTNEKCLESVRKKLGNRESQVRQWFLNFLGARYKGSDVTAEELKGYGHIDLKLFHPNMGFKIIEFKGWWNSDKSKVSYQATKYLTDAESEGFIFMINDLKKKDIKEEYKMLIEQESDGYIEKSWKEIKIPNNAITYFESQYQSGTKLKTLYHFIFNAWF